MKCMEDKILLLRYLDNEVTPEERRSIEAHLSVCPSCKEVEEALANTQRELRQALESISAGVSPSSHTWANIKQRLIIEEEQRGGGILNRVRAKIKGVLVSLKSRRPVWQTALASVVSVALIFGLCLAISSWQDEPSLEKQIADIAEKDPQMQAFFSYDNTLNSVVPLDGADEDIFYRVTYTINGYPETGGEPMVVDAIVNLKDASVVQISNNYVLQLTEEDRQRAIDIAKSNSFYDDTAVVVEVTALPVSNQSSSDPYLIGLVDVQLAQSGVIWSNKVDLTDGTVTSMEEVGE